MTGDNGEGPELTSEECVRAGMYWFGRSDFAAADAWWRRALEIDPDNTRAQECLRLLSHSSTTGLGAGVPTSGSRVPIENDDEEDDGPIPLMRHDFRSESSAENMAVLTAGDDGEPSLPRKAAIIDDAPAMVLDPSGDLRLDDDDDLRSSRDLPPVLDRPHGTEFPFYDDPDPKPESPTDAFDFAATGQRVSGAITPVRPQNPAPRSSPWDEGPSRTSVLNIDTDEGDYDAVADQTPLPAIDRERFFRRADLETPREIMDYLRATGDLPNTADLDTFGTASRSLSDLPLSQDLIAPEPDGIQFDEPVEYAAPEAPPPTPSTPSSPPAHGAAAILAEGRRRYQLHDFGGALEVLESIPSDTPEANEARNLTASARREMLKMYESKIGDFEQVPRVLISSEEIIWLSLDHRAGFILSQIDGSVTYEDIISLSGMPRLDTVQILSKLLSDRVIGAD